MRWRAAQLPRRALATGGQASGQASVRLEDVRERVALVRLDAAGAKVNTVRSTKTLSAGTISSGSSRSGRSTVI